MKHLNFVTWKFHRFDGYGLYSIDTVKALNRAGYFVRPMTKGELLSTEHNDEDILRMAGVSWDGITVQCMPARDFARVKGRMWGLSMFETDTVPELWAMSVNTLCERLIVPCEHYETAFKRAGVNVPVHTIHGGTDPDAFPIVRPSNRELFTFMCLGDRGVRKGTEDAINGFIAAFPKTNKNVRLIVKARPAMGRHLAPATLLDNRIQIWLDETPAMADVLKHADCFVYPGYGDGWGKTPRESAMMGIPTIAPRHTGTAVGIDHWATVILEKHYMQRAGLYEDNPTGQWFTPDRDELITAMQYVYECRSEAHEKAFKAAQWLRRHQTWDHSAQQWTRLLERVG
jgi:glycosyltransferase involved in cell wall biosynthesis